MPQAGFEPVQNLSSGFDEYSCAVVTATTPWYRSRYWQYLLPRLVQSVLNPLHMTLNKNQAV